MKLFGTSGIRGYTQKTNKTDYVTLSNTFCKKITTVFIEFLKTKGKIAVGMDFRESSPRIQKAILKAVCDAGCIPINCGITPIPALTYYVKNSDCIGGIMVTGSHIKASMNGLKFITATEEISKEDEKTLEQMYTPFHEQAFDFEETSDSIYESFPESQCANQAYIDLLISKSHDFSNLKIVIDVRNTCHAKTIPQILKAKGAHVIELQKTDEAFVALDTDANTQNTEMKDAIFAHQADAGLTYDSDGDRPSIYDENGNVLIGDVIATIIADHLDAQKIATPINTSSIIDTINKQIIRSKVGSPYVIAAMKEHGCEFGFEGNGGSIFSDIMLTRDGGYPTIFILNLLVSKQIKLSELVKQYPKFFTHKDKFDCPTNCNQAILDAAKEKYHGQTIDDKDGVKVIFADKSWLLFRPSSNSPEFRVFAESTSPERTLELASQGLEFARLKMNGFQAKSL